jgi:hypothetical protein
LVDLHSRRKFTCPLRKNEKNDKKIKISSGWVDYPKQVNLKVDDKLLLWASFPPHILTVEVIRNEV